MFESGGLEKFQSNLSKEDKKILEEFRSYCSISAGKNTCIEIGRSIIQLMYVIDKPIKDFGLEDLRGFLAKLSNSGRSVHTCNKIKTHIKRFLRWKFKDYPTRFNDLEDIKQVNNKFNEEKINSDTLLTPKDVEKIVKDEPNIFWKTFFIVLYESGCRPIELRLLKWKNISFNIDKDDLSKIHIFATKTSKSRDIYVQSGTKFLKELREMRNNPESSSLVFSAVSNKNEPMDKSTVSVWLKRRSKSALGRSVNPYLLRHSRATELYLNANIPDSVAQKFLGHGKDMKDVYNHLSSEDVKLAVSKTIYNFEIVSPDKKADYDLKIKKLEEGVENLRAENQEIKKLLNQVLEKGIPAVK